MRGPTHILGGVAAAAISLQTLNIHTNDPIVFYSCAIIGSIIPDICHPKSMIGRRLPVLSTIVNKVFGHRSFTHSLLFVLCIYWATGFITLPSAASIQIGLLAGVISHIVLDILTPRGVELLYPIRTPIRLPLSIRTSSAIGETLINAALIVIVVMMYI